MFLKSLRISNVGGLIREIRFRAGLNLIVDETPSQSVQATGNNVGKTTVLMLIDFCLGGSGKGIYTDPENRKTQYAFVKDFLVDSAVLVTLVLKRDLEDPYAEELVIERNFLSRKDLIRRINGIQRSEDDFDAALTESLFPGHWGKKPTFPQIISHNIRYKEPGLSNTLRTLNEYTRDDEYETLYLFLLGCDFDRGDARQNLLAQIRMEHAFKTRLESQQTRSAYEASVALLSAEIASLNERRIGFHTNPNFTDDLALFDEVRYKINVASKSISHLKLRRSLINEAVQEIHAGRAQPDIKQLKDLYSDVSGRLSSVHRTFEELVAFHNRMVDEKARYISKEIPVLEKNLVEQEESLKALIEEEKALSSKIDKGGSLRNLEELVVELNDKHRRLGEFETILKQITSVDGTIGELTYSLDEIESQLFSPEFEASIRTQLNKLNRRFSAISQELYGERYALKFDRVTNKTGQRVYKFSSFNANISAGKKQGEITCFDIAYTLFADENGIPCYHFLLNDRKELMHDNQLAKIAALVSRERAHVQFVAAILRDKLPPELDDEKYFALALSQDDKLFRIESRG